MKFMIKIKADKNSEAGVMPSEQSEVKEPSLCRQLLQPAHAHQIFHGLHKVRALFG